MDRKTNHQDFVKAEAQPRPVRPPPWRDKLQRDIPHDWRKCDKGRKFVVACNPVQRHEATSQEVMNFHLCLSIPINSLWKALEMKARSPEKFVDVSDVKVIDEDGFLFCSMMIKAKNIIMERIWTFSRSSRLHVRMSKKSGWNHGCDPPSRVPLGKSTHIEIRDVGGTFSFSFNGVLQCTIDYTGHVLHARTDRDVYVSDPWHTASDLTLSFHRVHSVVFV